MYFDKNDDSGKEDGSNNVELLNKKKRVKRAKKSEKNSNKTTKQSKNKKSLNKSKVLSVKKSRGNLFFGYACILQQTRLLDN